MARLENVPRGKPIWQKEACSPFDIGFIYDKVSPFQLSRKKSSSRMYGARGAILTLNSRRQWRVTEELEGLIDIG